MAQRRFFPNLTVSHGVPLAGVARPSPVVEGVPGAYLAGFLSALMAERRPSAKRPVADSMVGSYPDVNENVVSTFKDAA